MSFQIKMNIGGLISDSAKYRTLMTGTFFLKPRKLVFMSIGCVQILDFYKTSLQLEMDIRILLEPHFLLRLKNVIKHKSHLALKREILRKY